MASASYWIDTGPIQPLGAVTKALEVDVLVVGGGNSGCDIAVDVSRTASRAFISLRRGYWFIPKHLFGVPADVFGHRGPELPRWIEQPVFERLLRLLLGDPTRLGLPAPDHRLFETHPVLNTQLLHALGHGELGVKPDVRELRGRRRLPRQRHHLPHADLHFRRVRIHLRARRHQADRSDRARLQGHAVRRRRQPAGLQRQHGPARRR